MANVNKLLSVKEAYRIFSSIRKDLYTRTCYEYDSCFVFQAVHHKLANSKDGGAEFDSLYFVDKQTRKCGMFKPFYISAEEYNRGKRVMNFK